MHRHHPAERLEFVGVAGRFERDDHADPAEPVGHRIVHVARHHALADRKLGGAAQRHVLADLGDGVGDGIGDGDAADRRGEDLVDVGPVSSAASAIIFTSPWNRSLRATKSVSEFTSTRTPLFADDRDADQAFGGDPPGLFRGLGQPFLAQPVDRGFEIAAAFVSAALQSIMPAPVWSRSSFTMDALMFVVIDVDPCSSSFGAEQATEPEIHSHVASIWRDPSKPHYSAVMDAEPGASRHPNDAR